MTFLCSQKVLAFRSCESQFFSSVVGSCVVTFTVIPVRAEKRRVGLVATCRLDSATACAVGGEY